jgi:hypothetical protein
MSTDTTQPQYPDLDQARVQAAQAARSILAARTVLTAASVTAGDVIVLADWLLDSSVEIADDEQPEPLTAAALIAAYDAKRSDQ